MNGLCTRVGIVARANPRRVAIVDDERKICYAELWELAHGFADHLRMQGLAAGDRVALILPNRVESVVACYGTWLAGCILVPLNVQARARDFVGWLRHSGVRHVVYEEGHADAAQAAEEVGLQNNRTVALEGQSLCPTGNAAAPMRGNPRDEHSLAVILYTSGTTGSPKGVMLSHSNLLANAEAVTAYLGITAEDRVLSVLPFYYAYGASVLHTHLISGALIVLAKNLLFPHLVLETAAREVVTAMSGVPSTYALLLEHALPGPYDLSALRCLTQAGGPMSPRLTRRLRAALPQAQLFVMYGQTEATSRISWLPPRLLDKKIGSVGIPISGVTWKIVREDGSNAAPGENGELWVNGPNIMLGYWNSPDATASVLRDGWLCTGDMGHLDEEGYLFLLGRRSDMIKTGANRVHPNDIEEVIAEIPGVSEVAVVGLDDEIMGQVLKAYVVASERPPRAEDRIKAYCRQHLAPYKVPRHIAFVDALPRTASGKVRRFQLIEQYAIP